MSSPGSGSSSDVIRLDDRDSQISYTPLQNWVTGGGGSGEYLSTTVGTRTAGAQMRFTFTGTYVAVYGTISGNLASRPTSNIFTLSSTSNPSEHVLTWTASPVQNAAYNSKFYESPAGLKYGTYTLTMDVGVTDSETWIDYLELKQGSPGSSTTSTSPSTSPSQTSPSGNSQLSTGAIAGIAAGGAIVLILALLAVLFWRRKRSKRRYDVVKRDRQMSSSAPEPFPDNQTFSNYTSNVSFASPLSYSTNPSTGEPSATTHTSSRLSTPSSAAAIFPSTAPYRNDKRILQRHLTNGDETEGLPDEPPSYKP